MSTSANIIMKNNTELQIIGIWYDGYISYTGKTLYECYNTKEKLQELIDLGMLMSVGRNIENISETYKESIYKEEDETIAVYRDMLMKFKKNDPMNTPITTNKPWNELKPLIVNTELNVFEDDNIFNIIGDTEDGRVWTDPAYVYIFDVLDNTWYVKKYNENFKTLEQAIIQDEIAA